MDEGCAPSWAENYDTEEISAVQHAMNWLLFNPVGFWSECQNNPGGLKQTETKLVAEVLARKLRNLPRLVVPKTCQYLTAFIDVHARVLYYVVAAWEKQLGGGPIDYGTYPQQPVSLLLAGRGPGLHVVTFIPGLVEDAWLMAGLGTLVDRLIKTVYQREDAVPMRIGRLFMDVKWGEKNRLLKSFCRRHQHAGTILWPAQGIGIGASGKPFSEYRPEPGAEVGLNWRIAPPVAGDRWVTVRHELLENVFGHAADFPDQHAGRLGTIRPRSPRARTVCRPSLRRGADRGPGPWAARFMNGNTSQAGQIIIFLIVSSVRPWPPQ